MKFQPQPQFTGTATGVEVQREDTNGTPVKAKYTPTVTPVKPTGEDVTSEDIQGAEQNGTPKFTPGNPDVAITITDEQPAKLIDPETGKPTDKNKVVIPGEGTYTIDPKSGEVKFQPEPQFSGQATGVTVQVKDANGTPVEASYTPKVKGVTPTATPAKSKGIQGKPQTGLPEFKGGTVTVNGVPKTVEIDETKAPKLLDPETGEPTDEPVVIPGEGTYTIEDGKVKFQPEPQFTGKGEGVEVQRVDKNGTPVTAKYTPKVVPVTPTGEDKTSVGPKGQPQTGTPEFQGGSVKINGKEETVEIDKDVPAKLVDPKTGNPVDSVTVEGEGTYTIDKDGKVTFTPEPEFLGTATGVTVQRVDKNGTEVTAKYTPTVTPVTATVDKTTEGPKNAPQSDTPEFTGDVDLDVPPTFSDGSTTKVIEGEGTYTIDKDGKVTFTPEPEFTGTADGITVIRKDKLGKTISAQYTPTVRPDTELVDENGNPIKGYPSEDGTTPKKDNVPEYRFVETKKLPDGDTEHIYEKVTTFFKDKDGKELPNTPSEKGIVEKKDVPGYKFLETKKLPNGDIEHVYEKVVTPTPTPTPFEYKVITTYVDENGELIIPDENGSHPGKELKGYEIVRTEKDENGNVRNIYRKVTTPETSIITTFVDENGNPILPNENGEVPAKDIPGYELVRTEKDANGNVRHVYHKIQETIQEQPVQQISEKEAEAKQELPNTGTEANASLAALGLLGALGGFRLLARKKKED